MDDLTTILQRVRAGDTDAFATIVQRFERMALGCSLSLLPDRLQAEEAAQNAFVTAWLNLDSLREDDAFPGWFRRILFTECARLRRARRCDSELITEELTDPAPTADELFAVAEQTDDVDALVAALPELARQVVILHYLAQLSLREIAAFLGVAEGTVKKRLHDARQRLRREIDSMTPANHLPTDGFGARTIALITHAAEAIATGDAPRLRALLTDHPSLVHAGGALDFRYGDYTYFTGATLLHHVTGQPVPLNPMPPQAVDLVSVLLAAGADANALTSTGATALALVAASGPARATGQQIGLIDALVAGGTDPNAGARRSALENALIHGHLDAARRLRDHGAAVDLRLAAGLGDVAAMQGFVDADGRLTEEAGALAWAPGQRAPEPCAPEPCATEPCDSAGVLSQALALAVINGQLDASQWLVEHSADVGAIVPRLHGGGQTPLHHACSGVARPGAEGVEVVRWLLAAGADVTRRDEGGPQATPAGWATHGGRADLLAVLLEHDAGEADSLLRYAVERLRVADRPQAREAGLQVARTLRAAGADPRVPGRHGTALDRAADDEELLALLA